MAVTKVLLSDAGVMQVPLKRKGEPDCNKFTEYLVVYRKKWYSRKRCLTIDGRNIRVFNSEEEAERVASDIQNGILSPPPVFSNKLNIIRYGRRLHKQGMTTVTPHE